MWSETKFWDEDSFFEKRWGCRWYPAYDKLGHFTIYLLAVLICRQFVDVRIAFAIWQAIGVLYEFIWETIRGRKPSWRDLIANFAGGISGLLMGGSLCANII